MRRQDAHRSRREDRIRIALLLALTVITPVLGFSFSYRGRRASAYPDSRIAELHSSVAAFRAFVSADSARQRAIRRVVGIIDRYNPSLPQATKQKIAATIYEMSMKYDNLSVDLICATITQESLWRPEAVSPAGALGLMQIMPSTGLLLAYMEGVPWTYPEEVLFDPLTSIRLGCRYLSTLIELYGIEGGLAAYNSGERRAILWLACNRDYRVLREETRNYIPSVLELLKRFESEANLM
ncbi:MAG: lytic transglycosylase domain-containing protein [candidate division KSB1 bacterium]|nr:lytic transglycosylase domain-containing protein [candidate division KSB1 bacterium]